jgi:hypothetical protein
MSDLMSPQSDDDTRPRPSRSLRSQGGQLLASFKQLPTLLRRLIVWAAGWTVLGLIWLAFQGLNAAVGWAQHRWPALVLWTCVTLVVVFWAGEGIFDIGKWLLWDLPHDPEERARVKRELTVAWRTFYYGLRALRWKDRRRALYGRIQDAWGGWRLHGWQCPVPAVPRNELDARLDKRLHLARQATAWQQRANAPEPQRTHPVQTSAPWPNTPLPPRLSICRNS